MRDLSLNFGHDAPPPAPPVYRSLNTICDLTNSSFRFVVRSSAEEYAIDHESIRMRIHSGNVWDLRSIERASD